MTRRASRRRIEQCIGAIRELAAPPSLDAHIIVRNVSGATLKLGCFVKWKDDPINREISGYATTPDEVAGITQAGRSKDIPDGELFLMRRVELPQVGISFIVDAVRLGNRNAP